MYLRVPPQRGSCDELWSCAALGKGSVPFLRSGNPNESAILDTTERIARFRLQCEYQMSGAHKDELSLNELHELRDYARSLRGRIGSLPPEPRSDRAAFFDLNLPGLYSLVNFARPPATDSRTALEHALENLLSTIDSYLLSRAGRR